jgi:L-ascorbate metabolism protein UlaG (beta-lactamase superfamily)
VGAPAEEVRRPHPTRLTITWLGHSTTLVETVGARVITDPLLRGRVAHLRRAAPPVGPIDGIDAVLISHAHRDHLDLPSLKRLPRVPVVVPRGVGALLRRAGFAQVIEVEPGDELDLGGLRISATFADHDSRRGLRKSDARAVGYVIGDELRTYFAGDTDLVDEMHELRGQIDVALLPISGWGPRVPEGHMDPVRAALALERIEPRMCIPIHWGTYRPIYRRTPYAADANAAMRFSEIAAKLTPQVAVRVLRPGDRFTTT